MSLNRLVTLVIPAKGRPRQTEALLSSLEQCQVDCMIILIDDGSDPSLEETVRRHSGLCLIYHRNEMSVGPAVSRNTGLRMAQTPYVAFTDNDVTVREGWLNRLVIHMEHAPWDVAGAGGPVRDDGRTIVGEYATRHGLLDPFVREGRVLYLVTANCIFRREVLLSVGGFDTGFTVPGGEDPEVCFRLLRRGFRLEVVPDAVVTHSYPSSWLTFYRTFVRYGRGCARAMRTLAGYSNPR